MNRAKIKQLLDASLDAMKKSLDDLALKLNAELDAPDPVVTPPKPKSLRDIIEAAPDGALLLLSGEYAVIGPIQIDKKLALQGPARIIYAGGIDTGLFTLTKNVKNFIARDLTVAGGKANYVIRSDGASNIEGRNLRTVKQGSDGCGIFFGNGVDGVSLFSCETEFTTVYSFYCGGSETSLNNKNILLDHCVWGKTDSHCMRTYGVSKMEIRDCKMYNPKSASGRQCIKVMNGEDITIKRTTFDGTTRFGRDINDPPTYKLKNVLLEEIDFKDWTRTDSDNVTYDNVSVTADNSGFCFHLFGKTVLKDVRATYVGPNGKLASNTQNIVSKSNVTFNGQPA